MEWFSVFLVVCLQHMLGSKVFMEHETKTEPDDQKYEEHGYTVLELKSSKALKAKEKGLKQRKIVHFLKTVP